MADAKVIRNAVAVHQAAAKYYRRFLTRPRDSVEKQFAEALRQALRESRAAIEARDSRWLDEIGGRIRKLTMDFCLYRYQQGR